MSLFGQCCIGSVKQDGFRINSAKHKALIVLLAAGEGGTRTRAFLQGMLWGKTCFDEGRQSFRRALSDLRRITGEEFAKLFPVVGQDMTLSIPAIAFEGSPESGLFLDGLDVREQGFVEWRDRMRNEPQALWRFVEPLAAKSGCASNAARGAR